MLSLLHRVVCFPCPCCGAAAFVDFAPFYCLILCALVRYFLVAFLVFIACKVMALHLFTFIYILMFYSHADKFVKCLHRFRVHVCKILSKQHVIWCTRHHSLCALKKWQARNVPTFILTWWCLCYHILSFLLQKPSRSQWLRWGPWVGGGGEREKGGTKHPLYIDDIIQHHTY